MEIDELVSEVATEIHHYFDIDAISIVLRSDCKNQLSIYSTDYLDEHHRAHQESEVDERYVFRTCVQSQEMLLISPSERYAPPTNAAVRNLGQPATKPVSLPLMSGKTMLAYSSWHSAKSKCFHYRVP
ncbi:GAF domain-containing protein [Shigella flexneri]